MLDGYDKDWQSGVDIHEARYSSVPSGNYTFKVKASFDGINWTNANNEINLRHNTSPGAALVVYHQPCINHCGRLFIIFQISL